MLSPSRGRPLPRNDRNQNNADTDELGSPAKVRKTISSSLNLDDQNSSKNLDDQNYSKGPNGTTPSQPPANIPVPIQRIDNEAAPLGDNIIPAAHESGVHGDDPQAGKTLQEETLRLVLEELRDIKSQMAEIKDIKSKVDKLDKIEATTTSLAEEMSGVVGRTAELDSAVASNAARLREVDDEMSTMKASISKQDRFLSKVSDWKEEITKSNTRSVSKMNELIKTQQKQVDLFHENSNQVQKDILMEVLKEVDKKLSQSNRNQMKEVDKKLSQSNQNQMKEVDKKLSQSSQNQMKEVDKKISQSKQSQDASAKNNSKTAKREVMAEVDQKVSDLKQDIQSQYLKNQAFDNRFNLIVLGLKEDDQKSTIDLIKDYFTNAVGVKDSSIVTAYRLGSRPEAGNNHSRPIMVKFGKLPHRNRIWRKRMILPNEDDTSRVKIQADLPKVLREGMHDMYRVLRAAGKIEEFKSAQINNYQLELNGKIYQVSDLEKLPIQIRPSTLSSPKSDTAMVFFTHHSFMSNHHASTFNIADHTFHSMEHYLAVKRASLSSDPAILDKARKVKDPMQAKHILHSLKEDHPDEWCDIVATTAMEGLRAKFSQNKLLADKLCNTFPLVLGEASKNERWGIGMDLNDPNVLDQEKWLPSGNLLGRSLMEVRQELLDIRATNQRR